MIKLVLPASGHKQAVIEYKNEMLDYNSDFDGCGGLEKAYNYEEWLDGERLRKRLYGNDTVPSDVYLAIRENDNKLLGMIDIRYELSDFLLMYGGSIGYSVRPTERGKGYATQMLTKLLCRLRGTDIDRV